jgi:serine/threonine protein kinase
MDIGTARALVRGHARATKSSGPTLQTAIGQGQHGAVFGGTFEGAPVAVKIVSLDAWGTPLGAFAAFAHEVKMQRAFARKGLAPKLRKSFAVRADGRTHGVIVMDRVDGTLAQLLYRHPKACAHVAKLIAHLLRRLRALRLVHGDMHLDNIAFVRVPELQLRLIDFGASYAAAPNAKWEEYNASMSARGAPKCLRDAGIVMPAGFPNAIRNDTHYLQVYDGMHEAVAEARRRGGVPTVVTVQTVQTVQAVRANKKSPPRTDKRKSPNRDQAIADMWLAQVGKKNKKV